MLSRADDLVLEAVGWLESSKDVAKNPRKGARWKDQRGYLYNHGANRNPVTPATGAIDRAALIISHAQAS
jgi:hypothetical protein